MSLGDDLRREAIRLAREHFGPDATSDQIERVYDCEMALFTFHAATGDDADCVCGAHRLEIPDASLRYGSEDFG